MRLDLLHEEIRRYHSEPPKIEKSTVQATVVPQQGAHYHGPHTLIDPKARLSVYCARNSSMSHWRCQVDWCECDCHDVTGYGV